MFQKLKESGTAAPNRLCEHIAYWMSLESLRKADQELQRGYMSMFLIRYVLKLEGKYSKSSKACFFLLHLAQSPKDDLDATGR